jgi:L-lactate dehydrogenase
MTDSTIKTTEPTRAAPRAQQPRRASATSTRHSPSGVAVVGAGNVGAAVANALVLLGTTDRVVLYDRQLTRAEGEAWDIADGTPLLRNVEVVATDDWLELRGGQVVVVTVGALMRPGQSRLDERNGDLIREVIGRLDAVAPRAVVVIVSNPVDVMTRIAQDASTRPRHLIVGAGTVLDTARLRQGLAKQLGVDAQNTHVHVIGEHGDSSFPAWSTATIGPVPLTSFPLAPGQSLAAVQAACAERTRRRAPEEFVRKGHTNAGIAVVASRIVECVLRDQRRIFTLSTRALADYGIGEEAVLSLPCVLGREGVIRRLPLALDHREQQMLARSAAVLEAAYRDHSRAIIHDDRPEAVNRRPRLSAGRAAAPDARPLR